MIFLFRGEYMKREETIFLTIEEVAKKATVSTRHVANEIKRGNLKAFKPGKRLLFNSEDVEKWIKRKAV
jgi:excisionase family DNA binding protein